MPEVLNQRYHALKKLAYGQLGTELVGDLIVDIVLRARSLLDTYEHVPLTSRVVGKRYFGFRSATESRPINGGLYIQGAQSFHKAMEDFRQGFPGISSEGVTKTVYTMASCVLAAHDVNRVGRKASATFFEILIGHLVARALGIFPRKKVRMPESKSELPTDYVFDPGPRSRKIHLPIKTSTRERAVQAWVHQLVLDRIFGNGEYLGILVVSGETKRNTNTGEVVEICVPRQLQMFQSRVAEISRIYYLDPPQAYLSLSTGHPRIQVKPFGEAFAELPGLLHH